MGGQPRSQRVVSMTRPSATHAAPYQLARTSTGTVTRRTLVARPSRDRGRPRNSRYFETMTQTPKTTLPANAKAATAPSTM
jgi:hypothetical protein